jgi:hypothetical protein
MYRYRRRPLLYKYIVNNTRMYILLFTHLTIGSYKLTVLFLISSTSSIHELSDELILLINEKIIEVSFQNRHMDGRNNSSRFPNELWE